MPRLSQQRIATGLNAALVGAAPEKARLKDLKIVVFSDHHRGTGDRADDFRTCRRIYHAALAYYLELGHRLVLLGDVEEMWERPLGSIIRRYQTTLELERCFFAAQRGVRLLGNHDESLIWPWHRNALAPYLCDAPLLESLCIELSDETVGAEPARLFFAHGHQGLAYTAFDRFVVRQIWARLQGLTGWKFGSGTPAENHDLRRSHELALYHWAASLTSPHLLICGHTHHPVFMSTALDATLRDTLALYREENRDPEQIALLEAELYWILAEVDEMRTALPAQAKPCYFNTGCCSFEDGSITGIEITDGNIRLIRWRGAENKPQRQILQEASLSSIIRSCRGA